ncbi:hypothetical protein VTK26DRAFT_1230 [Humicola hyalothermophila]
MYLYVMWEKGGRLCPLFQVLDIPVGLFSFCHVSLCQGLTTPTISSDEKYRTTINSLPGNLQIASPNPNVLPFPLSPIFSFPPTTTVVAVYSPLCSISPPNENILPPSPRHPPSPAPTPPPLLTILSISYPAPTPSPIPIPMPIPPSETSRLSSTKS